MGNNEGTPDSVPPLQFVNMTGTPVTGRHRDKKERIREAMSDLQLAIDGCRVQVTQSEDYSHFSQSVSALARACSIFLRKLVVGDRNDKSTRLLDDDICQSIELSFERIRKVPESRIPLTISLGISGGYLEVHSLDETTSLPKHIYKLPIGSQQLELSVEWPLPGMADWTKQPTEEEPWQIKPEALFDTGSRPLTNCDNWLGQQLVLFDNRGITLKEIIQTTTNTEGAHSANISRLMRNQDEGETNANKNPEIHILNNIKVSGLKYNHIIVVESALYLYDKLIGNGFIDRPEGDIFVPKLCIVMDSSDDAFSSNRNWLSYDGGLILSLSDEGQSISHRIRAPK